MDAKAPSNGNAYTCTVGGLKRPEVEIRCARCKFPNFIPQLVEKHLKKRASGPMGSHVAENQPVASQPFTNQSTKRICPDMQPNVTKQVEQSVNRPRIDDVQCTIPIEVRNTVDSSAAPPRDNGPGISTANQPIVTQMFQQNYNLVYMTDEQLNHFMESSRIRAQNGRLYMIDKKPT